MLALTVYEQPQIYHLSQASIITQMPQHNNYHAITTYQSIDYNIQNKQNNQSPSNIHHLSLNTTQSHKAMQRPLIPTQPQAPIPNAQVINYIRQKCSLSIQQIQSRLLQGKFFNQINEKDNDPDISKMEEVLRENDFYEKPQQKALRQQTMKFVKKVIDDWSISIAKSEMRISQDQIPNYMAKLLPFGSYVLDLKSNTSDIDIICVCPNFIKRETHFFEGLYNRFQKDPDVRNLSKVINARVPIMTFIYKDTDIDISFCQLPTETVPRDIEKVITKDLVDSIEDDKSKTSILGRKNNLMILELTGKQVENFKETLRVVKVWAKNRAISSNGMGYLGGISWAILVAKICQVFPNHKPMKLLEQFFRLYSIWSWKSMPVNIMASNESHSKYLMCVVTPGSVYNSTERVNEITFKVLQQEIKRANELLLIKRPLSQVCRKVDFINQFPLYIEIDICGKGISKQEEKEYKEFQGNVESRILRLLTSIIDSNRRQIEEESLKLVPHPSLYKKKDPVYDLCNALFLGVRIKNDVQIDLGVPVTKWAHMINMTRGEREYLNLRIFEGRKQDFLDVQIAEPPKKKKEEKMDPRLARLVKTGA